MSLSRKPCGGPARTLPLMGALEEHADVHKATKTEQPKINAVFIKSHNRGSDAYCTIVRRSQRLWNLSRFAEYLPRRNVRRPILSMNALRSYDAQHEAFRRRTLRRSSGAWQWLGFFRDGCGTHQVSQLPRDRPMPATGEACSSAISLRQAGLTKRAPAGGTLHCLGKQIPNPCRSHGDEHLHKI